MDVTLYLGELHEEKRRVGAELEKQSGDLEKQKARMDQMKQVLFFFFFALVTGPGRSLSLKLSDTRVYEPQIRLLPDSISRSREPAWTR